MVVLIHHSGEWINTNNFMNYFMDGVLITMYNDFNGFIRVISTHLNVNLFINIFEFRYKIDEDSMPISIRNILGLRVYIKLRKASTNLKHYPVCITWKIIDLDHTLIIDGEQTEYSSEQLLLMAPTFQMI